MRPERMSDERRSRSASRCSAERFACISSYRRLLIGIVAKGRSEKSDDDMTRRNLYPRRSARFHDLPDAGSRRQRSRRLRFAKSVTTEHFGAIIFGKAAPIAIFVMFATAGAGQ